jgi:predicted nucleotidyltransferase
VSIVEESVMHLSPDSVRRLARIAVKHGVVKAFVFGSFARGDAGPGSDLDVLVELEPGRSLLDLARLEDELEDSLGLDVDVVTAKSLFPEVLERVMAERKAVL